MPSQKQVLRGPRHVYMPSWSASIFVNQSVLVNASAGAHLPRMPSRKMRNALHAPAKPTFFCNHAAAKVFVLARLADRELRFKRTWRNTCTYHITIALSV